MTLSEDNRRILVKREYEKAERFYSQAVKNAAIEEWDVVANRIYYAIFHAVAALLIHDGHKVATHKGAVMVFGQHYVRTGIFSTDTGRFYSQLQTIREKADYNCDWIGSEDVVKPFIPKSRIFIDEIKKRISTYLS